MIVTRSAESQLLASAAWRPVGAAGGLARVGASRSLGSFSGEGGTKKKRPLTRTAASRRDGDENQLAWPHQSQEGYRVGHAPGRFNLAWCPMFSEFQMLTSSAFASEAG